MIYGKKILYAYVLLGQIATHHSQTQLPCLFSFVSTVKKC